MDETQMMRDLLARYKPVIDSVGIFISHANGLNGHGNSCPVCKYQEPTVDTCAFGALVKAATQQSLENLRGAYSNLFPPVSKENRPETIGGSEANGT